MYQSALEMEVLVNNIEEGLGYLITDKTKNMLNGLGFAISIETQKTAWAIRKPYNFAGIPDLIKLSSNDHSIKSSHIGKNDQETTCNVLSELGLDIEDLNIRSIFLHEEEDAPNRQTYTTHDFVSDKHTAKWVGFAYIRTDDYLDDDDDGSEYLLDRELRNDLIMLSMGASNELVEISINRQDNAVTHIEFIKKNTVAINKLLVMMLEIWLGAAPLD